MDRDEAVQYLTANCDCWKKDGADEVLNALDDDQVVELAENALVVNSARELVGDKKLAANAMPEMMRKMMKGKAPAKKGEEEEEDEEEYKVPSANQVKELTEEEFMALAPPAIRRAVRNAQAADAKERKGLISRLLGNSEGKLRQRLIAKYEALDTEDLRDFVTALPPVWNVRSGDDDDDGDDDSGDAKYRIPRRTRTANYSGAGPNYVGHYVGAGRPPGGTRKRTLRPVVYNWAEIVEANRKQDTKG